MVSLVFDVASSSYKKGKTRLEPRYFHNERSLFFIFDQPPDSWIFLLAAPDSLSIHGLAWLMIVVVTACAGAIGRDAWTYVHGVTRNCRCKMVYDLWPQKENEWKNWLEKLNGLSWFAIPIWRVGRSMILADRWFRKDWMYTIVQKYLQSVCRNDDRIWLMFTS